MPDPTPLGPVLLALRLSQHLSRYGLARRSGVAEARIKAIEEGADPRWSTVCRLAVGLGVSPNEFLTTKERRR